LFNACVCQALFLALGIKQRRKIDMVAVLMQLAVSWMRQILILYKLQYVQEKKSYFTLLFY
jgi:hypothetical protein